MPETGAVVVEVRADSPEAQAFLESCRDEITHLQVLVVALLRRTFSVRVELTQAELDAAARVGSFSEEWDRSLSPACLAVWADRVPSEQSP